MVLVSRQASSAFIISQYNIAKYRTTYYYFKFVARTFYRMRERIFVLKSYIKPNPLKLDEMNPKVSEKLRVYPIFRISIFSTIALATKIQ